ncbi:hypothetical protein SAMN04488543_1832 [Friedmanniella luteola]|uniref:Uncharacterized protein n=1 Tax=Friedmanniella luteola TaxID=546871 RepID=A0A1H1SM80_9ACTN|nr:hypothetical protein [Friedmanniella luteola]SDS49072.1 hypothetical protein SAMN04488543_1832 [Friedmanniella luteola]
MRRWLAMADAVVQSLLRGLGTAATRFDTPTPDGRVEDDPRHR